MTSTLYLIPTPLGDPDDITLRALRILKEVSAIAAESQTDAQSLMDHYGITTPIIAPRIALNALNEGDVALVTSAGTPGMGDWAHEIVVEAIAHGIRVELLPGASAEITALVLSGLSTEAFVYVGKMPDDLTRYAHERDTMIFAVDDMPRALRLLLDGLGDRRVCLCARLTQPDETIYRGSCSAALRDAFGADSDLSLIVVEGAPAEIAEVWDEARVRVALRQRLAEGEMLKKAAKAVADVAGWDRRAVYALGVDEKQNPP